MFQSIIKNLIIPQSFNKAISNIILRLYVRVVKFIFYKSFCILSQLSSLASYKHENNYFILISLLKTSPTGANFTARSAPTQWKGNGITYPTASERNASLAPPFNYIYFRIPSPCQQVNTISSTMICPNFNKIVFYNSG